VVNSHRLTIYGAAGVRRELLVQFIAAHDGKPPWSTKEFVSTVREIQHYDVVNSGIFPDEFSDKHPGEWKKLAFSTLEEATEAYIVEVLNESY